MHPPFTGPLAAAPVVADLLADPRVPPIGPGAPVRARLATLQALTPQSLCQEGPVRDLLMARCCLAGLWLRYDFLDLSHEVSQTIDTPSGSYWHGMMHRREGDFANAKYWFRRAGRHPFTAEFSHQLSERCSMWGHLATRGIVPRNADESWKAMHFVDSCESALIHDDRALEAECQAVAWLEWHSLFGFCWRQAFEIDG